MDYNNERPHSRLGDFAPTEFPALRAANSEEQIPSRFQPGLSACKRLGNVEGLISTRQ